MTDFNTELEQTAKGGTSDFDVASEGVHKALCTKVIYMGIVPGSEMYPAPKPKVRLEFELLEDGTFIGTEYTLSLGKKSRLLKDLQTWTETVIDAEVGFNIFNQYGKTCKLQLDQKTSQAGNVYNRVISILKSDHDQEAKGDCLAYSVEHHDEAVFNQFPEFIQNTIRSSEEWGRDDKSEAEAANPAAPTPTQIDEQSKNTDLDDMFN